MEKSEDFWTLHASHHYADLDVLKGRRPGVGTGDVEKHMVGFGLLACCIKAQLEDDREMSVVRSMKS